MTSVCIVIASPPCRTAPPLPSMEEGPSTRWLNAAGSEEALALLTREPVDLILFPLHGGAEVIRELRRLCRHAAGKEVPVVACNAAGAEECILALEAGAADALPACISPRESSLRLRRQLELKRRLDRLRRDRDALSREALTDSLTGLGNRRFFQQQLVAEAARTSRTGDPFALMMIDLDHFKRVNDTFGHAAGDLVLQAVAGVLRHGLRRSDVACRIGGEEFVLVLPGTTSDSAGLLGAKLRERIAAACREIVPEEWPVTVSIGISWAVGPGPIDIERLQREADRALYAAKESGRNRIVYALPELPLAVPAGILPS